MTINYKRKILEMTRNNISTYVENPIVSFPPTQRLQLSQFLLIFWVACDGQPISNQTRSPITVIGIITCVVIKKLALAVLS